MPLAALCPAFSRAPSDGRMDADAATIVELRLGRETVSALAHGTHQAGIGRVGFVLVDLGEDPAPNVVDRKDVDYEIGRASCRERV